MGAKEQPPLFLRIHEHMQTGGFTTLDNARRLLVAGPSQCFAVAKALWSHYRRLDGTLVETDIANQEEEIIWNRVYSRLLDKLNYLEDVLSW